MLREISIARKVHGAYERRWYEDERSDLFVWFDPGGDIARFQLTYDKPNAEKAIDWKRGRGFMNMRVDDGANPGHHAGTPLLSMGGAFAKDRVIERFREHAADIDAKVSTFVLQTLQKFPQYSTGSLASKLVVIGALVGGLLITWRLMR